MFYIYEHTAKFSDRKINIHIDRWIYKYSNIDRYILYNIERTEIEG